MNAQVIVLVLTIIALIHVNNHHRVHRMPFALYEITQRIASVQIPYQMEIHCHIVNNLVLLQADQNVDMMTIVQVNWHVFERNVLNHAENYRHVLHQLDAVFWTVHQYEQWFVNVPNSLCQMKMVNVVVL